MALGCFWRQSQLDESFLEAGACRGGLLCSAGSSILHLDCHPGTVSGRAGRPVWESSAGGSVYMRRCCRPHPDCPSGCWVTQDLPTRLNMLGQAPASSSSLTPSQQALVGPTASSHVHLQVAMSLQDTLLWLLLKPCPALVADQSSRWSPRWLGTLLEKAP